MEYVISLLLSILGNLLTPTAKKILRWPLKPSNPRRLSLPKATELEFITEEKKEEIRAYNRQRLDRAGQLVAMHLSTSFFLWTAFFLPLLWKTIFVGDVKFQNTRLAFLNLDLVFYQGRIGLLALRLASYFTCYLGF